MKITVVGLGKLGCPLAAWLSTRHEVVGIDLNPDTVDAVNDGLAPVEEPGLQELMGGFVASTDFSSARGSDAAFVIVPTPSLPDGAFSLEHVKAALDGLRPHHHGPLVVTSTVMPGHMGSLRWRGPLLYNPWFVALGSVLDGFRRPPFVLIGERREEDGRWLSQFWRDMDVHAKVRRMPFVDAEIAKLALNCYVVTKIAFANYLDELCSSLGADGRRVANAVGLDPRVGSRYFQPGGPPGGPCFPRDSRALVRASKLASVAPRIPEAVDLANAWRRWSLTERASRWQTVAVLGLAYKPGTGCTEESFGANLADDLEHTLGRFVLRHDPLVAPGDAQALVDAADAVVVATPWPEYASLDYRGKPVVDPWGMTG